MRCEVSGSNTFYGPLSPCKTVFGYGGQTLMGWLLVKVRLWAHSPDSHSLWKDPCIRGLPEITMALVSEGVTSDIVG